MFTPMLHKMVEAQASLNTAIHETIMALSPESDGGEAITADEASAILRPLKVTIASLLELSHSIERGTVIAQCNNLVVSKIDNCDLCAIVEPMATVNDLTANPVFPMAVFAIKNLLEDIDDRIAEKNHRGIRKCIDGIRMELENFPQLKEVSQALEEVSCTFTDTTAVSDMMYDFEKFFISVFLRHEELNVGIALGSIKSVLPPPSEEDGEVEFF